MTLDIDEHAFRKGVPWKERRELIAERFPSVVNLDWEKVFEDDPTILGRIINDILRAEIPQNRPGKRPALDPDDAADRLKRLIGEDFSLLPFPETFERLKGSRSLRHLQNNTGLDKMKISNLLKGKEKPTLEEIIVIAEGLGKHPSYFMEYREMFVMSFCFAAMRDNPESGLIQYKKLRDSHGNH